MEETTQRGVFSTPVREPPRFNASTSSPRSAFAVGCPVDDFALTLAERLLFEAFDDCGVRYILLGMGSALLEGAPVATQDLDVWLETVEDERVRQAARDAGGFWISGFGTQPPASICPDHTLSVGGRLQTGMAYLGPQSKTLRSSTMQQSGLPPDVRHLSAILITLYAVAAVPARAQNVERLTLHQAVSEALIHNDRMVNQRDFVEQARLGVRLARNNFQPKLVPNISGSFGQTDVSNQTYRVDLLQRFTTGTEVRLGVGTTTSQIPAVPGSPNQDDIRFYNADTTFSLTQPLLKGFGPAVGRRQLTSAEVRQTDAARQQTMAEQAIAVEVAAAYYRVVAQEALVDVARSSLDRARKLREASEAKLDAGLVSQLDVFRAQQLVSQSEIQWLDAQAAIGDARDQLRFLMGRDSDEPFEVARDIPRVDTPIAADEAVAIALAKRLDLQGALAAAADAERAAAFSRNQLLPQFDVNLALTRRETAGSLGRSFGLDGFQFATFMTISMPVDRTPQQIEYQNSLIERDRRTREIETLRKRIGDDVRRVIRQRERVIRNLAAAEASVDIGRREVEVAQLRYERGLSNNLEVVTAEGNLLSIESRRISALADSAVTNLALRATLGILEPLKDIVDAVP